MAKKNSNIRYYFPNLKSHNSYHIREFSELNEQTIAQIKADLAQLKEWEQNYQFMEVEENFYYREKDHTLYRANEPEKQEDQQVESPFIQIVLKDQFDEQGRPVRLEYNRSAFEQLALYQSITAFEKKNTSNTSQATSSKSRHKRSNSEPQTKDTSTPISDEINNTSTSTTSSEPVHVILNSTRRTAQKRNTDTPLIIKANSSISDNQLLAQLKAWFDRLSETVSQFFSPAKPQTNQKQTAQPRALSASR